jgi:hypothetical protein
LFWNIVRGNHKLRSLFFLSYLCLYSAPVLPFRHNEQTFPLTLERPEFTQAALFLGIVVAPTVSPFVLHDQVTTLLQLADKVRIEFVGRGLEPEGEFLLFKIPNPEFHFIHLIQCLSTKKLLAFLLNLIHL